MRFKFLNLNKISQLPKIPGVYCFKNNGKILYIGKATNIGERVKNHFQQPTFKDEVLLNLVKQLGYIKTNSEIEALVLEANLIKKYQPKYNVIWKDDKNYFFVGVTKEDFPRVFITHQTRNTKYKIRNTKFIGPFVDGKALKQTLKVLRKVFPYRSCKTLPKRPCLWYHLDRCLAPCLAVKGRTSDQLPNFYLQIKKEGQKNAKNLMKILQGKKKQVLKDLKKEMKKTSISENFEEAAKIRDQISALEKIVSHAKIFELFTPEIQLDKYWDNIQNILQKIIKTKQKISRIEAYDISNIQGKEATGSAVTFINGKPNKNFYRRFKIRIQGKPNDVAMIKEILERRLKHTEWPYPELILIDGGKPQLNSAKEVCAKLCAKLNLAQIAQIRVAAIAKKKNELFINAQKKPILLKSLPREIFNLILQIRDEAHRFAISYHRKLRKKDLLEE